MQPLIKYCLLLSFVMIWVVGLSQNNLNSIQNSDANQVQNHTVLVKVDARHATEFPDNFDRKKNPNTKVLPAKLESVSTSGISKLLELKDGQKWLEVTYDSNADIKDVIAELQELNGVLVVEPAPYYYACNQPLITFNDPLRVNQEELQLLNASAIPNLPQGMALVAVIDDAFALAHEDIVSNYYANPGENGKDANGNNKRTNGIDDDGNGYIDDHSGWDFADFDNNPRPPPSAEDSYFGHGTFIAGQIGGITNNNLGIASIGLNRLKILPIKAVANASNDPRKYSTTDLIESIGYAIMQGSDVINMSWGSYVESQLMHDIIKFGKENNVIFVAAAGNDNITDPFYPAAFPEVISVGSLTRENKKSSFSNYGEYVDLFAPGSAVFSTRPDLNNPLGSYGSGSGTSFSCSYVSAMAGLMRSVDSGLSVEFVRNKIEENAQSLDAIDPRYPGQLGAGKPDITKIFSGFDLDFQLSYKINLTNLIKSGESIQFSNSSRGIRPYSIQWHFEGGEPATSSELSPKVKYDAAGMFNVTLTAKTLEGNPVELHHPDVIIVDENKNQNMLGAEMANSANGTVDYDKKFSKIGVVYSHAPGKYIRGARLSIEDFTNTFTTNNYRAFFALEVYGVKDDGTVGKLLYTQYINNKSISENNKQNWDISFFEGVKIPDNGLFLIAFNYNSPGNLGLLTFEYQNIPGFGTRYFYSSPVNGWIKNEDLPEISNGIPSIYPIITDKKEILNSNFKVNRISACTNQSIFGEILNPLPDVDYVWWTNPALILNQTPSSIRFEYETPKTYSLSVLAKKSFIIDKRSLQVTFEVKETTKAIVEILNCNNAPIPDFKVYSTTVMVGDTVELINNSQNASDFKWVMPDASPMYSQEVNPSITYSKPGLYRITLKAKHLQSQYVTLSKANFIQVVEAPSTKGPDIISAQEFSGNHWKIYPNPNSNRILNIQLLNNTIEDDYMLTFATLAGQVIRKERIEFSANTASYTFTLGNVASGVYLIMLENNNSQPIIDRLIIH